MKQGLLTQTYPYPLSLILTLTLIEKCKSAPKQSIETHSAWFLIPPATAEDVDWSFFPEDIEFALPDETGFRGFIVEFYNVISGRSVDFIAPLDCPLD